ncbi:MAG: penicillin-binding transpeptidase domain-containing protein [Actinomycetota bacterium]|nr:penicillin-binding transpeptidase domain-containing protein [Actinomycetota bacterium]
MTLSNALRFSVDTAIARVGAELGRETMTNYMRRFGFYTSARIGDGRAALPASGVLLGGRVVTPLQPGVPLGALAVGRAGLIVTPLQMAMVASAVAGGGTLMTPHLDRRTPSVQSRVMTPTTARALTAMLRVVVTGGTGTPADLRGGRIAGRRPRFRSRRVVMARPTSGSWASRRPITRPSRSPSRWSSSTAVSGGRAPPRSPPA